MQIFTFILFVFRCGGRNNTAILLDVPGRKTYDFEAALCLTPCRVMKKRFGAKL